MYGTHAAIALFVSMRYEIKGKSGFLRISNEILMEEQEAFIIWSRWLFFFLFHIRSLLKYIAFPHLSSYWASFSSPHFMCCLDLHLFFLYLFYFSFIIYFCKRTDVFIQFPWVFAQIFSVLKISQTVPFFWLPSIP